LKRFGLALPGAEFFLLMKQPALRTNGKMFAMWWAPDKRAVMKLERGHQTMLFEVRPEIFSPCPVGTGLWSYVEVALLSRAELKDLVVEAWAQIAPKKISRAFFAAPSPKASRTSRSS
jgi:hypothetical protein